MDKMITVVKDVAYQNPEQSLWYERSTLVREILIVSYLEIW